MSRVGRDASGRTYVGVDWARDLFDFGPLQSSPPTYNRLDNPAYPVPVRARLVAAAGILVLGTAYLGVYSGGAAEAARGVRRGLRRRVEPRSPTRSASTPSIRGVTATGMSDPNLRTQVDVAKTLGVETFMLDDQWQGGPGASPATGTSTRRGSRTATATAVPDFVDLPAQQGIAARTVDVTAGVQHGVADLRGSSRLGLRTDRRPDRAGARRRRPRRLGRDEPGVPGLPARRHRPPGRDHDVREFKFDFMAWVDCCRTTTPTTRTPSSRWCARMEQRHPDVTFELDETNDQRAWPFESAALGPSWFDNAHMHDITRSRSCCTTCGPRRHGCRRRPSASAPSTAP